MSKQNSVMKYATSGLSDTLALFGVPTATVMNIYQDILDKRANEAFEILVSEIRDGNFDEQDQHEVVSVCARYQRDAMEGVAKQNLRLLARVINGMAEENELRAPTFLKYANILASLNEEEITVLGIMACQKDAQGNPIKGDIEKTKSKALYDALQEVVPGDPEIILQTLLRTGLVKMDTGSYYGSSSGVDTSKYTLTPLMDEILRYTDL